MFHFHFPTAPLRRAALFLAALTLAVGLALPRSVARPYDNAEAGCRLRGFDSADLECGAVILPPSMDISDLTPAPLQWGSLTPPTRININLNCHPKPGASVNIYYHNLNADGSTDTTGKPDYLLPADSKTWPTIVHVDPTDRKWHFNVRLNPVYTAQSTPPYPSLPVSGEVFATGDGLAPTPTSPLVAPCVIEIQPPVGSPLAPRTIYQSADIKTGGQSIPISLEAESVLIAAQSQEVRIVADSVAIPEPHATGPTAAQPAARAQAGHPLPPALRDKIMIACATPYRDYFQVVTAGNKLHSLPYHLPLNNLSRYTTFTIRLVKPHQSTVTLPHFVLFYSYLKSGTDPDGTATRGATVSIY